MSKSSIAISDEIKKQIKDEMWEELVKEIPDRFNSLINFVDIEGLSTNKLYVVKVHFKDNIDRERIVNYLQNLSKCFNYSGLKYILIPCSNSDIVENIEITGDSNV